MKKFFAAVLFILLVSVFTGISDVTHVYATQYVITDLGTLGGPGSAAFGINDQGQVVGNSYTADGGTSAFLYENGVMTDLGVYGLTGESFAWCINNLGGVAGTMNDLPFFYENGLLTGLEASYGYARAVNDKGQVVGATDVPGSSSHAFLYANGVLTDLGTLGGETSSAGGINNMGQIAGTSDLADGSYHAFVYENGVMVDLGALEGGRNSSAWGINDLGQVIGYSGGMDGYFHAFLYEGGVMKDIALPNVHTLAWGINDSGTVVGQADGAFVYENGSLSSLYDLVLNVGEWGYLSRATAINNLGQIVGYGQIGDETHGFLLTEAEAPAPVPEPATLILLGIGFAGLAAARRKEWGGGEYL